MKFPDQFRAIIKGFPEYNSRPGDDYGLFIVTRGPCGRGLKIIANGADPLSDGWEHVSVSILDDRRRPTPTWAEMAYVKSLFWNDDETVVEFHVPSSDHVNFHRGCLHLWRKPSVEFPRPPSILVGPKPETTEPTS